MKRFCGSFPRMNFAVKCFHGRKAAPWKRFDGFGARFRRCRDVQTLFEIILTVETFGLVSLSRLMPGGGGRGRAWRFWRKTGGRGNRFDVATFTFWVPVETERGARQKSEVETRVDGHPWKPFCPPKETSNGRTWKRGRGGNEGEGHPWKPKMVSTGARFCK